MNLAAGTSRPGTRRNIDFRETKRLAAKYSGAMNPIPRSWYKIPQMLGLYGELAKFKFYFGAFLPCYHGPPVLLSISLDSKNGNEWQHRRQEI